MLRKSSQSWLVEGQFYLFLFIHLFILIDANQRHAAKALRRRWMGRGGIYSFLLNLRDGSFLMQSIFFLLTHEQTFHL